jgi:drug/metabolite transporter (DMT)-like permease
MPLYPLAIGLTIVANVGYHLCQKAIRPDASPAASLVAIYAVALVLSAMLWPWLGGGEGLVPALRRLGPVPYALGVCVVLIELGFLLAYRSGWTLGTAALYCNAAVALVLVPVGVLAFGEGLDVRKGLGLLLALGGLALLTGGPIRPAETTDANADPNAGLDADPR